MTCLNNVNTLIGLFRGMILDSLRGTSLAWRHAGAMIRVRNEYRYGCNRNDPPIGIYRKANIPHCESFRLLLDKSAVSVFDARHGALQRAALHIFQGA